MPPKCKQILLSSPLLSSPLLSSPLTTQFDREEDEFAMECFLLRSLQ